MLLVAPSMSFGVSRCLSQCQCMCLCSVYRLVGFRFGMDGVDWGPFRNGEVTVRVEQCVR